MEDYVRAHCRWIIAECSEFECRRSTTSAAATFGDARAACPQAARSHAAPAQLGRCQSCRALQQDYQNSASWHDRHRPTLSPAHPRRYTAATATATRRHDRNEGSGYQGQGHDRRYSSGRRDGAGRGQQRGNKPTLNQDFFARESWAQVGANESMIEALKSLGLSRPSHVQAEALQASFSGDYQCTQTHGIANHTLPGIPTTGATESHVLHTRAVDRRGE